jgi:septum formation protein
VTAARLVLASASAGRRDVLLRAGVTPQVVVSDVDEPALLEALGPADPAAQVLHLARAKAVDVASRLDAGLAEDPAVVVVGCDSMLDVDGTAVGKPADAAEAKERWQRDMAGRSAVLRTGHWVVHPASGRSVGEVASTTVWHGTPTDAELDAYIATGEPLRVAGAFTIDGLGGPFVERIEGDPSNVIGVSLPVLRRLLGDLGITWTDLWTST